MEACTADGTFHKFLAEIKELKIDDKLAEALNNSSKPTNPGETSAQIAAQKLNKCLSTLLSCEFRTFDTLRRVRDQHRRHGASPPSLGGKSDVDANNARAIGNQLYAQRRFRDAIEMYGKGLRLSVSTASLALTFASRSAAFFEQRRYEDCLRDIDRAIDHGYPDTKRYRLDERRAKCLTLLGTGISANNDPFLLRQQQAPPDGFVGAAWIGDKPNLSHGRNARYPQMGDCLRVVADSGGAGRRIIAAKDIIPGQILVVDDPYVSCLESKAEGTHCHQCFEYSDSMIPCHNCSTVMFCSEQCRTAAETYHKRECPILHFLQFDQSLPVRNDVFRLFSSRSLDYFLHNESQVRSAIQDVHIGRLRGPVPPCDPDCLANFFALTNHIEAADSNSLFKSACLGVYLTHCLELTDFFLGDDVASYDRIRFYIAQLIVSASLVLATNSYLVKEVRLNVKNAWESDSEGVASACYPVTSYFNHACFPNAVRDYCRKAMVIMSVMEIPAGTEVTVLYGYHFTKFPKADRQVYLRDNYNFDCKCVACDGDWPVLEETETREFDCARLCQKCNATLSNEEMESSVNCKECGAELDETARELAMRWRDVMQIVNGARESSAVGAGDTDTCSKAYWKRAIEVLK
ncbi:unnamed protein product, partial [Notodromas monacha]